MKALILAAGYATRLHPLTENQPKSLLEVGNNTIMGHILQKLQPIKEVEEVFIVTNHRFYDNFRIWLNHSPYSKKVKLLDDGTLNNTDRLGAVGDLNFVLQEEEIKDDLLIIAGDNLFEFPLSRLIAASIEKKRSVMAFHDFKDKEKIKGKYGVGVLSGSKLTHFEEKPLQPKSSLASTGCYLLLKKDLPLIEKSLLEGKADNPGDLIKFLTKHSEVHGLVFDEPWFDVGSFESLQAAQEVYQR